MRKKRKQNKTPSHSRFHGRSDSSPAKKGEKSMKDVIVIVAVVAAWIVVQRLLPPAIPVKVDVEPPLQFDLAYDEYAKDIDKFFEEKK